MAQLEIQVDVFFDDYNTGGSLGILDKHALDDLNTPEQWFQVNKKPKRFTLDDIRKRFVSTNPLVVIYACKSGTDPQFIQKLSDTLDFIVDGFRQKIAYCPKYAIPPWAPNLERNRIGMSDCATFVTTNFYELLPFAARRSVDITKQRDRRAVRGQPSLRKSPHLCDRKRLNEDAKSIYANDGGSGAGSEKEL